MLWLQGMLQGMRETWRLLIKSQSKRGLLFTVLRAIFSVTCLFLQSKRFKKKKGGRGGEKKEEGRVKAGRQGEREGGKKPTQIDPSTMQMFYTNYFIYLHSYLVIAIL